jgi:hypothetical protein
MLLFIISKDFIETFNNVGISYGLNNATVFEIQETNKYPKGILIWIPNGENYEIGFIEHENLLKLYREMYKNKVDEHIICLRNPRDDKRIRNCKFNHEWTFVKNVESANDMDYTIMKPWMNLYNVQRNEFMISALTEKENYGGILHVENDEIKISPLKIDSTLQGFGSIKIDEDTDIYKFGIYDGTKYKYLGLSDEKFVIPNHTSFSIQKIKLFEDKMNENVMSIKIQKTNKNESGFSFNLIVFGFIDSTDKDLNKGFNVINSTP